MVNFSYREGKFYLSRLVRIEAVYRVNSSIIYRDYREFEFEVCESFEESLMPSKQRNPGAFEERKSLLQADLGTIVLPLQRMQLPITRTRFHSGILSQRIRTEKCS